MSEPMFAERIPPGPLPLSIPLYNLPAFWTGVLRVREEMFDVAACARVRRILSHLHDGGTIERIKEFHDWLSWR